MQIENAKILIVAAHPDDEILGLGGAVHKWTSRHASEARALILGEGLTSRDTEMSQAEWAEDLVVHRRHIKEATQAVGYHSYQAYDFPDNQFDSVALLNIVKVVEAEIASFKPDVVLTHHAHDLNVDHRLTSEAVLTALRPQPGAIKPILMTFQTLSATEWQYPEPHLAFQPNCFVALTKEDIEAKKKALSMYQFELRDYPHPRSLQGMEILARHWGMLIGVEFAEAFSVKRLIL